MGTKRYSLSHVGSDDLSIQYKAAWSKARVKLGDKELDAFDYMPDVSDGKMYELANGHRLRIAFQRTDKWGRPQGIVVEVDGEPHPNSVNHPTYLLRSLGYVYFVLAGIRLVGGFIAVVLALGAGGSVDAAVATQFVFAIVIVLVLSCAYAFVGWQTRKGSTSAYWTGVVLLTIEITIMMIQNMPGIWFNGMILAGLAGMGTTLILQSRQRPSN